MAGARAMVLVCAALFGAAAAVSVCSGVAGDLSADCQMGWATQGPGGATTGGEGASAASTFTCTTRAQFVTALSKTGIGKRIIYVSGSIRADDLGNGKYADEAYYRSTPTANSFSPSGYLKTLNTQGLLAYRANVQQQIMFYVPSDTSIIGLGSDAKLLGFWFRLPATTSNVIIRNVYIETPQDVTSEWSSGDGWNAEFDGMTIEGATRVWIDHVTMTDGRFPESSAPVFKGKPALYHDGMIDMKRMADFITISHSVFTTHDKTFLIGHSDSFSGDTGHLRITMYGNVFTSLTQRQPRIRFGQVHLLANVYEAGSDMTYFIGMGKSCNILSEYNMFEVPASSSKKIVKNFKGKNFDDVGSWVQGAAGSATVKAAAKAAGAGTSGAGFKPPYKYAGPASYAKDIVKANAGAGILKITARDASAPCTPNPNYTCPDSQTCGTIWDGCMLVVCGFCPQGSKCDGARCQTVNDYIDVSPSNPQPQSVIDAPFDWDTFESSDEEPLMAANDNRTMSLDVEDLSWVQAVPFKVPQGWSVVDDTVNIATGVYTALRYIGVQGAWTNVLGITNISASVTLKDDADAGAVGIGMYLGQGTNPNRIEWVLEIDGDAATSQLCVTIKGKKQCTATLPHKVDWNTGVANNFTASVIGGDTDLGILGYLNGFALSQAPLKVPKADFQAPGSVFLSTNGTFASFSNFNIRSAAVVHTYLSGCHTQAKWDSFASGLMGATVTQGKKPCAARRAGEAATFSAFETLIADDAGLGVPSFQAASTFVNTAVEQGVAASAGFSVEAAGAAVPTLAFVTVAAVAPAYVAAAAGLSAGAIAGIVIGAAAATAAVGGAVATGVHVVRNRSREERAPTEQPTAVAMAPVPGINVMSPAPGQVHSSITARAAPIITQA